MDMTKKIRGNRGYIVSFIIIGVAMLGWLPGFALPHTSLLNTTLFTLAKIAAFGGMAMFAWSLILSGRYKAIDTLFHGLDKVYVAHRMFGSLGLLLLVLHPIALTLLRIPEQGFSALGMWVNVTYLPVTLGIVSLYLFLGMIIWSIFSKAKHETFVAVHRLLGPIFILGAAHAFLAGSIIATNAFMFWYLLILCSAATVSYVHYSILSDVLHRFYRYKVIAKKILPGEVVQIKLRPKYRVLNFTPGQFVYVSFDHMGSREYHPFSIASGKKSSDLELYIKELGDFTRSLDKIKLGETVKVKGPYGGFTFEDKRFEKQLWIAGGIGITPFLSKARSLQHARKWPQVELIYATQSKNEGFAIKELTRLQHQNQSFNFTLVHATKFGQKSLHDLHEHFGDLKDYAIYLCGPPPMLRAYQAQAEALGLENQLFFEEFSY
jgi:predicted ferric reductase